MIQTNTTNIPTQHPHEDIVWIFLGLGLTYITIMIWCTRHACRTPQKPPENPKEIKTHYLVLDPELPPVPTRHPNPFHASSRPYRFE